MDGASKFVRGDAIAGLMIMVINVVGGLLVGVVQHGMELGAAAESYTLLTIGDGLVAQIPALVISTAAGVIVTRVATDQDVGEQMVGQLFNNPKVMLLCAAVLGLLGLVPGMPNRSSCCLPPRCSGWLVARARKQAPKPPTNPSCRRIPGRGSQLGGRTVGRSAGHGSGLPADPDGRFSAKWRAVGAYPRDPQEIRPEMGYLPPVVHIRDNLELAPARYRILMKGVEIGSGEAQPGAG